MLGKLVLNQDYLCLGCDVVQFGRCVPTFWRNQLPSWHMEVEILSEMLVPIHQTTRCHIAEDLKSLYPPQ
jgi:hypothetical protein